jgi:hypothetical protein
MSKIAINFKDKKVEEYKYWTNALKYIHIIRKKQVPLLNDFLYDLFHTQKSSKFCLGWNKSVLPVSRTEPENINTVDPWHPYKSNLATRTVHAQFT